MRPEDHALLLEHQARCQSLYKQAYQKRLVEIQASQLQKNAQSLAGLQPSLTLDPMRGLGGGLMGLGLGALGGLAAPDHAGTLMGGGALLGGLGGALSRETELSHQEELMAMELERQKQMAMEQYKAQLSGAEV